MVTQAVPPAALAATEAARYMGIPRSTFDRLAKSNCGIYGIRIGGRLVFRVQSLDSYLAKKESEAAGHAQDEEPTSA